MKSLSLPDRMKLVVSQTTASATYIFIDTMWGGTTTHRWIPSDIINITLNYFHKFTFTFFHFRQCDARMSKRQNFKFPFSTFSQWQWCRPSAVLYTFAPATAINIDDTPIPIQLSPSASSQSVLSQSQPQPANICVGKQPLLMVYVLDTIMNTLFFSWNIIKMKDLASTVRSIPFGFCVSSPCSVHLCLCKPSGGADYIYNADYDDEWGGGKGIKKKNEKRKMLLFFFGKKLSVCMRAM